MENNNELNALKERVIHQLNDFYRGNSWVTNNFKERIFLLPGDVATKKAPGNTHSIAALTAHINALRNFVLQKLTGNDGFDIDDNSIAVWTVPFNWSIMQKEFENCHTDLVNAVEAFAGESLPGTVPGRTYTFLFLLNEIVEHDYYHYGQIGSVMAAIKMLK